MTAQGYKLPGGNVVITPFYDKAQPLFNLTNFAKMPINVGGIHYPTSEHFFQAQKFIGPPDLRQRFLDKVKLLGDGPMAALNTARDWTAGNGPSGVPKWSPADWDQWDGTAQPDGTKTGGIKLDVMKEALRAKLEQYPALKKELMNTGNSCLVEDTGKFDENNWGWGADGNGTNLLGKMWMELRNDAHRENGRPDLVVDVDTLYKQAQDERKPLGNHKNMMHNWPGVINVSIPQVVQPNVTQRSQTPSLPDDAPHSFLPNMENRRAFHGSNPQQMVKAISGAIDIGIIRDHDPKKQDMRVVKFTFANKEEADAFRASVPGLTNNKGPIETDDPLTFLLGEKRAAVYIQNSLKKLPGDIHVSNTAGQNAVTQLKNKLPISGPVSGPLQTHTTKMKNN